MNKVLASALMATALMASLSATAQTVWRCGADGRTFSDRPCALGETMTLASRVPRAAVAEAHAVRAREQIALKTLSAQREARHAQASTRGAAGIQPLPLSKPERPPRKKRQAR